MLFYYKLLSPPLITLIVLAFTHSSTFAQTETPKGNIQQKTELIPTFHSKRSIGILQEPTWKRKQ
jgi:hypothetical protein